ncbi:FAD-dependent oxidoreductase [Klebsiella pneumoniae subsp. pneumoniae]|nr:FAD-dependent oxidoreductase [Klebsiella pneumoniae subsp. pneumoniae]
MPLLPLENGASSKARSVNTGPFGETIGGDSAPGAPGQRQLMARSATMRQHTGGGAAMSAEPHIVIIGGGFSGAAVAIELLRLAPNGVRVTLLEPRQSPGAGVAYSTAEPTHRINVPAARMQLAGDEEGAFDHWYRHQPALPSMCRRCRPDGSVYPQRGQFESLCGAAFCRRRGVQRRTASPPARSGARFSSGTVTTDGGLQLKADLLVLAIGHPPPSLPAQAEAWRHHPALIANPWQPGALDAIAPHARVAVMGTGLTMADTVATLDRLGHRSSIVAFSRHGLLSRGNLSGAGATWPGATISRAACASACARSRLDVAYAAQQGLELAGGAGCGSSAGAADLGRRSASPIASVFCAICAITGMSTATAWRRRSPRCWRRASARAVCRCRRPGYCR